MSISTFVAFSTPSLPPSSPLPPSLLTLIVEDSAHNPLQHDGEAVGEGQVREQVLTHEQFQENDPKGPHIHLLGAGQGGGVNIIACSGCTVQRLPLAHRERLT